MTLNPPEPPTPEQFGLTQQQFNYFEKETDWGKRSSLALVLICANVLIYFFLIYIVFPNTHIPFLLGLFLALWPGFFIGGQLQDKIAEHKLRKTQKRVEYSNYMDLKKAFMNYNEALTAYNDLQRKIRRDEAKKNRDRKRLAEKNAEWWRGIDGRRFELEVAKILLNNNFNVKHTGSSFGDRGIDLLVKDNERTIIVQCKAFKNYISAGVVRELYGTLIHEKADEAWLVVTSGFYKGAKEFASDKPICLLTIRDLIKIPPNTYKATRD